MANNPGETPSDDFLDQILGFPSYSAGAEVNLTENEAMMLQLSSGVSSVHLGSMGRGPYGVGGFPSGLSLEQGNRVRLNDASGSGHSFHDDNVADSCGYSRLKPGFHGQPIMNTIPAMPHPPAVRPRVRARRGQATDPHSIAERLRRVRIAERVRALQDLVPCVNKTDRAAMLDEIVEYVKFLRLQVKVLSMSRLGIAIAVAPLVADTPISSIEDEGSDSGKTQPALEKWLNDGTEEQVAKLMKEDVGAAMQFLQSKALCIMPISLASAIYPMHPPDTTILAKPEYDSLS